jgi:hypothetical protein
VQAVLVPRGLQQWLKDWTGGSLHDLHQGISEGIGFCSAIIQIPPQEILQKHPLRGSDARRVLWAGIRKSSSRSLDGGALGGLIEQGSAGVTRFVTEALM